VRYYTPRMNIWVSIAIRISRTNMGIFSDPMKDPNGSFWRRVIRPEKVISRALKCETDFLRRTDRQTDNSGCPDPRPSKFFFFFSFSGIIGSIFEGFDYIKLIILKTLCTRDTYVIRYILTYVSYHRDYIKGIDRISVLTYVPYHAYTGVKD
jgi:hypothetical protein